MELQTNTGIDSIVLDQRAGRRESPSHSGSAPIRGSIFVFLGGLGAVAVKFAFYLRPSAFIGGSIGFLGGLGVPDRVRGRLGG